MAEYQNKTERALKNRWMDLKNRREELTMITCGELAKIPKGFDLPYVECKSVIQSQSDYCKTSCEYYKKKLLPNDEEMQEIRDSRPSFLD